MSDSDAFWAQELSDAPAPPQRQPVQLPFSQPGLVGITLRGIGIPVGGWPGWIEVDRDVVVIGTLWRTYAFHPASTRATTTGGSFSPRIRFVSDDESNVVHFMVLDDGHDVRVALELAGFFDW